MINDTQTFQTTSLHPIEERKIVVTYEKIFVRQHVLLDDTGFDQKNGGEAGIKFDTCKEMVEWLAKWKPIPVLHSALLTTIENERDPITGEEIARYFHIHAPVEELRQIHEHFKPKYEVKRRRA